MAIKEEQEVSTTAKSTLAENGTFDEAQEEELAEIDIDSDDSEPGWEEGKDPNLNEESWFGKRGSNKNPTRGVIGTQASPKGTKAGLKGTQAGPKGTQADPSPKTVKK